MSTPSMPPKRRFSSSQASEEDSQTGKSLPQVSSSESEESEEELEPIFKYRISHFHVPEGGDEKEIKDDLISSLKKFQKSVRQWQKRGEGRCTWASSDSSQKFGAPD